MHWRNTETWLKLGSQYIPPQVEHFNVSDEMNQRLRIYNGDITLLEVDAIVNAAGEDCLGGGGVDGAIHEAAGPGLLNECLRLGGCHQGQVKVTSGHNLSCNIIIHAVGPDEYNPDILRDTYMAALEAALQNGARSIAFPCISTGIYGFPNDKAAFIVSKSLRNFFQYHPRADDIDGVILCLYTLKDREVYLEALKMYFPLSQ